MITKQLTMIYDKGIPGDTGFYTMCFNSWKALHMHLFENGLYPEFQVFDDGFSVLHYDTVFRDQAYTGGQEYRLNFHESVPGSVLFEIVNRHASAKL